MLPPPPGAGNFASRARPPSSCLPARPSSSRRSEKLPLAREDLAEKPRATPFKPRAAIIIVARDEQTRDEFVWTPRRATRRGESRADI